MPVGKVNAGRARKGLVKTAKKRSSRVRSNLNDRRSRASRSKSRRPAQRASPHMQLTDLQNMAASLGIPYGGLSIGELARRINLKLHS